MTLINHNSFIYSFFLIGSFLLLNSCGSDKPPPINETPVGDRYSVEGKVLDENSNPIENAEISITAVQELPMFSNAQGDFKSGDRAKPFENKTIEARITIRAGGYTWEGYEEGKGIRLRNRDEDLGKFYLTKLGGLDDFGDNEDSDGDGVPDKNDNCPDEPNPDQIDLDENGIGDGCEKRVRVPPPPEERGFGIEFRPKSIVNNITSIMINEKQIYFGLEDENNQAEFDGNILYLSRTSTTRNIEIYFNNSDPVDIDFNDGSCDEVNNLLKLNFNAKNEIKKTDCFK